MTLNVLNPWRHPAQEEPHWKTGKHSICLCWCFWHFYCTLWRQINIQETAFWVTIAARLHFWYNVLRLIDKHASKIYLFFLFPADDWCYSATTMVDRHTPQHKVKESASLNEAIPLRDTDWSLCCLCQTSGGNTTCPATNGYPESYNTIANNVIALDKINQLPFPIDIRRLDNGSGIAASLLENKAIIHKACRIKTDDERVRRAQKRAAKTDNSSEVTSSPKKNSQHRRCKIQS